MDDPIAEFMVVNEIALIMAADPSRVKLGGTLCWMVVGEQWTDRLQARLLDRMQHLWPDLVCEVELLAEDRGPFVIEFNDPPEEC